MKAEDIHDDMIFVLSSRQLPAEIKLLNLELAVVSGLDGESTVKEVADSLDLQIVEVKNILEKLITAGLVERIHHPSKNLFVPVEVIEKIEQELIRILGPVAPVIIDDMIYRLGKRRNTLNTSLLAQFVDLLSNNISNRQKQNIFQLAVWEDVKNFCIQL